MKKHTVINRNRRLFQAIIIKIEFCGCDRTFSVSLVANNNENYSKHSDLVLELDGYEMHKYSNVLQVGNTVNVIWGRGHREWTIREINIKEDQRRWIQNKELEEKALKQYLEMTYEEEMALEKQLIEAEFA